MSASFASGAAAVYAAAGGGVFKAGTVCALASGTDATPRPAASISGRARLYRVLEIMAPARIPISAMMSADQCKIMTGPDLPVVPARGLAFDGDFGVAESHHAEQQRAAEPTDHGAKRHEGEEDQHPAIAFKAGGIENFDPGQAGADAKRGAAKRAQHQTY
jgi:hypothetical protein